MHYLPSLNRQLRIPEELSCRKESTWRMTSVRARLSRTKIQCLASPQDALDTWKQDKRKAIAESADFLHDLYGGVHDEALAAMNIDDHKDPGAVDWLTVKGLAPYEAIVRLFRSAGTCLLYTSPSPRD